LLERLGWRTEGARLAALRQELVPA
jgi:hypothetical protein